MSEAPAPRNGFFSARTAWDLREGTLAAAVRQAAAEGQTLIDLSLSNPTACGFDFDAERILGALTNPAALLYEPDPRGLLSAREAVARYYADHRADVSPANLLLATSTSEAYSFLFRLLCNAGDEVLVAQPSYPLFDFLAALDDVNLRSYPLFFDFGWWIDFAELERCIGPRTRAILLVHPNNPTGHATSPAERERLQELCLRYGLALVVDEVFLDYSLGEAIGTFAVGPHPVLTFVVSGLSKVAALPQMKVAWMACFGPDSLVSEALGRLEVIADTFLSMSAPVQHALPVWLAGRDEVVDAILSRVRANLELLTAQAPAGIDVLPVGAGWNAILRLPGPVEDDLEALVRSGGVIVHPGLFYGMPGRNRVVVSLIGPSAAFAEGVKRLGSWCEARRSE